jgi:hypothetical protein
VKDYLLHRRGVDAARVSFVQGGYRKSLTGELWVVAPGQQNPSATATIKRANVKFAGRKISKWRSLCAL